MKLTILLLLVSVTGVFANKSYAQNKRLNLNMREATVKEVLNSIEKQSEFYFLYSEDLINIKRKVNITIENKKIEQALNLIFEGTAVNYSIRDRIIVLTIPEVLPENSGILQQQRTVSGKVTDESGQPLPGVTVIVKGTTTGTITDVDGKYTISNISEGAILQFSFVGMKAQEIEIAAQTVVNITLESSTIGLEEVVAIGYGTMKKRDLTGSVSSISSDKIKERSSGNVLQSISGQLAGVKITQNSGAPGMAPSIRVRGASSITSGTTPLYVIDGIPLEDATTHDGNGQSGSSDLGYNMNPLNSINQSDIESIEVLKDASSTAIYGSRGANGVVLITTKQGKAGKNRIEASYEFGISKVARTVEMMNGPEFIEWATYYRNNTWQTLGGNIDDPNDVRPLQYQIPSMFSDPEWLERIGQGTDWQDVLFRTAYTHNAQVSASGGSKKTQYLLSVGYLDSEGVVENSYYDRLNVRTNLRHKFSDKFRTGMNISLSRSESQMFGDKGKSDAVSMALQSDPIFPVFTENGTLSHRDPESIWNVFEPYYFQLWHPYSYTRETENEKIINNIMAASFLEYDILPGLTLKTSMSGTTDYQLYQDYRNTGQNYGQAQYREAEANQKSQLLFNWIWENTLNYNKSIGDHSLAAFLGYSVQKQRTDYEEITASGFPNDLVKTINAATTISDAETTKTEWSMISYIARANYSYKGKYLFSAALRSDGSSRFGANSRWGYFPSASVGWRMSEEKFMKGTSKWLDNLKLRLSYGVTGNNQIPNYGAISQMSYSSYVMNGTNTSGMYQSEYVDKNLKWEKTNQVNIGFDASLFNNRLIFSYDYYYSKTKDLLLDVPIPDILGYSSTLTNIGELENKGMDFTVSTRNLTRKFKWNTEFNISGNRNKILKLGTNDSQIEMTRNSCSILIEVGKPLGNYYGYKYEGVIMSEAELTQYPVFANSEAGDPKIRDVNGDKLVDSKDRTIIGNSNPDFTWGLTNSFSYKGFDMSVLITGSYGNEIFNQQARFTMIGRANRNAYKEAFGFWRSEENPGDGWHCKPRDGQNTMQNQASSYWVEDGTFVRIKNIRLGYTLPKHLFQQIGATVKLYLNIENAYVFSDYINFDPEASTFQTGIFQGFDYAAYPSPRVCTIGVNLNF